MVAKVIRNAQCQLRSIGKPTRKVAGIKRSDLLLFVIYFASQSNGIKFVDCFYMCLE